MKSYSNGHADSRNLLHLAENIAFSPRMSDGERRLRVIAIGFAGVAMAVALTAALVVMRRSDRTSTPATTETEEPAIAPLIDRTVLATDVVRLRRHAIEPVVENGQVIGTKIKDPDLARMLGLEPDDIIVSLSGRSLTSDTDISDALVTISLLKSTTMYVEIKRGGTPTLVRWKLEGDLTDARHASSTYPLSGVPGIGTYTPPPLPPPDPMLDTIETIDSAHVKMPRKTAEYIFGNPVTTMKGARTVQAYKNAQPSGLKLYAVRPSSVFAKIGLKSGDTIVDINGTIVTTPDKALEIYTTLQKADEVTIGLTRRDGNPMQLHITITK